MSRILSIDASTEACSVALLNGDEVTERFELAPRQHAKLLLPMVEELLADSQCDLTQLDAIACNVGPGAFTGIRIAVSVAQGLSYGANLPTISLSTLANLASFGFAKTGQTEWLCAIDARMNEVYFASFRIKKEIPCLFDLEQVVAPELIDFNNLQKTYNFKEIGLIGSGWSVYAGSLFSNRKTKKHSNGLTQKQLLEACYPNAKYGLSQASVKFANNQILAPQDLQPTYLRNNVAAKKSVKI